MSAWDRHRQVNLEVDSSLYLATIRKVKTLLIYRIPEVHADVLIFSVLIRSNSTAPGPLEALLTAHE